MDPTVVAALIGAGGLIVAAIPGAIAAKRAKQTHDEVRTNHGLRQGDYIELTAMVVGELKDWSVQHAADDRRTFEALNAGQEEIRAEQARVAAALAQAIKDKP